MPEVYHEGALELSPLAAEYIKREKAKLWNLRLGRDEFGSPLPWTKKPITSAEFRARLYALEAEVMRDGTAFREVSPESNVRLRCPDCERVHIMRATVTHYQCPCSPHQDRTTLLHRVSGESE